MVTLRYSRTSTRCSTTPGFSPIPPRVSWREWKVPNLLSRPGVDVHHQGKMTAFAAGTRPILRPSYKRRRWTTRSSVNPRILYPNHQKINPDIYVMDAAVPFLNRKSHFSHPSASVMLNTDMLCFLIRRKHLDQLKSDCQVRGFSRTRPRGVWVGRMRFWMYTFDLWA
jgi:hypothetical protein